MTRPWDPFAPAKPVSEPEPSDDSTADDPGNEHDGGGAPDLRAIAAEIPDDLDDIHKDDLIALADLAGVANYGTKAAIAQRIRDAAATP